MITVTVHGTNNMKLLWWIHWIELFCTCRQ